MRTLYQNNINIIIKYNRKYIKSLFYNNITIDKLNILLSWNTQFNFEIISINNIYAI